MFGWCGKYLQVNLSSGKIEVKALDKELAREYIGQRGLGTRMIMEMMDPKVDPLSPENPIAFVTGPLTGVLGTSTGRFEVVTKSPLTGGMAGSNSGGYFGPELKYAGYDAVIITGKAEKPVYLWIYNDSVEIKDASNLWGLDVYETTERIKGETDEDAHVACIGPAGENLVKIACVMNDMHRAAGRSGVGAVMGSKNLKAVAVRGTGEIKVADPTGYMEIVAETRKALVGDGTSGGDLTIYGTPCLVSIVSESGGLPVNNHGKESGTWAGAPKINGDVLKEKFGVKNKGCFSCTVDCGRVTKVKEGPYKDYGEGPEYESIFALGAECGVTDLAPIAKAAFLCNQYGLDTISAGCTIACAMELYEKGIITKEEAQVPLNFGSGEAIVKMVEAMAKREGIGDKLAEGSYRLAEAYGHPELSMSVKKQEMAGYDARGAQGVGLGYATSNRGACHLRAPFSDYELVYHTLDPNTTEGKAQACIEMQHFMGFVDSAGMCSFVTTQVNEEVMAKMLRAVTGEEYTGEKLLKIGERIWNLERLFNLKAGWTKEDDTLPKRMFEEPLVTGPSKGEVNRLHEMLPEYYRLRGWDENGVPTKEKLAELSLEELA